MFDTITKPTSMLSNKLLAKKPATIKLKLKHMKERTVTVSHTIKVVLFLKNRPK